MRIGVDVHIAAKANRRGIPHYVVQVVSRLTTQHQDDDWVLLHVGGEDVQRQPSEFRKHPGFTFVPASRARTLLQMRFSRSGHDRFLGPCDAVFLPAPAPTEISPRLATVLTVHDVLHLTHRGHFGARHRAWQALIRPQRQIRRATLLLANSEHTRASLLRHSDISPDDVRVVPLGVDDEYFEAGPEGEPTEVLSRHGLTRGYVLHLGTIESRKNVASLIKAVRELRRRRPETVLVIAGAPGARARRELAELPDDGSVRLLGAVADDEKRGLYRGAGAYCSMSHEEGLGLTPLEALACGVPSVVSDIPAFRETIPESAVLVSARTDPTAIADALEKVLDDDRLRRRLLAGAEAVLHRYRWDACAGATYDALRAAARRS